MISLIQRVSSAKVVVDTKTVGEIEKGFLVLLGVFEDDNDSDLDYVLKKTENLRVFQDENGKMNLSLKDINGKFLVVSQFTLCADTKKGNRPSFTNAAKPEKAKMLYEKFIEILRKDGFIVETGLFGAEMKVSLLNDGPVTIIINSKDK